MDFAASRGPRALACALLTIALAVAGFATNASAQIGSERYSSIVVEAGSGRVLSSANADELRHPASLTKMMTLYMTFEALRDHRIGLRQLVPVSPHAAAQMPSKLGLMPGTRITVEEAVLGLVELLGGEEGRFAQMMTLRARALGMTSTTFRNASGLPDPGQVTTARDLALLARRLIRDFPDDYHYFSTPSFRFHGRTIFNHDHMLERYPGADGLKTGYIQSAGFNLVTSAVRGNVRLVGVVIGAAAPGERDQHMVTLLDEAYTRLDVPVLTAEASPRGSPFIATAHAAVPAARRRSVRSFSAG